MTRSYGAARSLRGPTAQARRALDPGFSRLAFTCFRLVEIEDPQPGDPRFDQVELLNTRNTMAAFMIAR